MSLVNFTSGINKIEQSKPLSEWAVEFIHSENLSRSGLSTSEVFRGLSRRERDAIRYQLRKLSSVPQSISKRPLPTMSAPRFSRPVKRNSVDLLRLGKVALGAWISMFLLCDIVKIYTAKGISLPVSWQAAILVELCILIASISPYPRMRKIAYLLFAYNMLLFGVMELGQISLKTETISQEIASIAAKENQVEELQEKLKKTSSETSKNFRRLDALLARGFVSSGSNAFEKITNSTATISESYKKDITGLKSDIGEIQRHKQSLFAIWASSILYFVLRSVLQFFSIQLLKREEN